MKKSLIIMLLMTCGIANAQVPNPIVHDPKNNAELMQLGMFLDKIKDQGKEALKTLETAKVIQEYAKARDFVKAIEESYCVVQDLDFYLTLSEEIGLKNEDCFEDFNYQINLRGIENAIWQTSMSLQSSVMTLGERQTAMQDAFSNLKQSNAELNEMKEAVKKRYKTSVDQKKSLNNLAEWF